MTRFLCLLACLCVLACSSETQKSETDTAAETHAAVQETAAADQVVELAVRHASCGCALEEIGHCGNYVEIGSKYYEVANGPELGLGQMEWCGQSGVKAKSEGVMANGKFVASTLEVE